MRTTENPDIAIPIVRAGGRDGGRDGDCHYRRIYYYQNSQSRRWMFAFFTHDRFDDMDRSPFVSSYVRLISDGELTKEGKRFLENYDLRNGTRG